MPFTGNFSIVQNTNLTSLTITDISSGGTDSNITFRHIFLYKADGTTLVPAGTTTDYINFPIVSGAGDSIILNVLQKDYSLSALIVWNSTSPIMGATYQKTIVFTSTGNLNKSLYGLIQSVSAQYSILNDTNYFENLSKLQVNIDCAVQANVYADQFSAQSGIDRAYALLNNQTSNF